MVFEDFDVIRGDNAARPAFFVGDELATFDCVMLTSFSLEKWGEEIWASDRFAHFRACRRGRSATTPGSSTC